MYEIILTKQIRKDIKLAKKRGKDLRKLEKVFDMLKDGKKLPQKYRNHVLKGKHIGVSECHIEPDWLLLYQIIGEELVIYAMGTGTHSDLFEE